MHRGMDSPIIIQSADYSMFCSRVGTRDGSKAKAELSRQVLAILVDVT